MDGVGWVGLVVVKYVPVLFYCLLFEGLIIRERGFVRTGSAFIMALCMSGFY